MLAPRSPKLASKTAQVSLKIPNLASKMPPRAAKMEFWRASWAYLGHVKARVALGPPPRMPPGPSQTTKMEPKRVQLWWTNYDINLTNMPKQRKRHTSRAAKTEP